MLNIHIKLMQINKFLLLVVFSLSFVTTAIAQHNRYKIKNGIGIIGGLTQYDITTDNFNTKSGSGFIGGMIATVDIPHKWFTVSYGLQFSQNSLEISGRPTTTTITQEQVEYKLIAVQATFLWHVKLLKDHLTIDLGPQLQYNSQLELKDDDQEEFIIDGYESLRAIDLKDISQFNVNGVVGASVGISNFRLRAAYSYGFTNILNKLNDANLSTETGAKKFKGNQNMLSLGLMITF